MSFIDFKLNDTFHIKPGGQTVSWLFKNIQN